MSRYGIVELLIPTWMYWFRPFGVVCSDGRCGNVEHRCDFSSLLVEVQRSSMWVDVAEVRDTKKSRYIKVPYIGIFRVGTHYNIIQVSQYNTTYFISLRWIRLAFSL